MLNRNRISVCAALAALFLFNGVLPTPAQAWVRGWRGGGQWYHGWHDGRPGWWWITAGSWYYFTRPVYPVPNTYYVAQPQTVIVQQPPMTVVQAAPQPPQLMPPAQAMTPPAPPAQATSFSPPAPTTPPGYPHGSWYYCSNPSGYYPSVQNCPQGWMPVN